MVVFKRSVKVMTAESPLTSVDFMSDGATLAVGSTRGMLRCYVVRFTFNSMQ